MELNIRRNDLLIQWVTSVGDLIILNTLFLLVSHELNIFYPGAISASFKEIILLLNFCYFFALYFRPIRLHGSVVFIEKIVQSAILLISFHIFLFSTCLIFLNIGSAITVFLLLFYALAIIILPIWRVLVRVLLKIYRKKGHDLKRIIIIGAGKNGMELYRIMKDEMAYGFTVAGFFDDNTALKDVLPDYLGATDEVNDYVGSHHIDEIYCTLPGTQDEKILKLLNFAEKHMVRFYIVPEFYRNVKKSLIMEVMETIPLLSIRREPLQAAYNRVLKRTFDITFSLLILVTIYPLLYLILGALIKRGSRGPVLFRQKRTGLYGHEFECYKFRTMRVNPDADTIQAVKDDPRKTPLGDFLRRTNLDEFPQFLNVLSGDMSVVGPRPHMLKHTEEYSALIDKYMVRHLVKPGLTGWAQVTGYRGETKTLGQMEGRVKRDVWYIENWSFFLDLKIITVTILNMFKGESNAY
ncbi:MAG: undecaprenyl-phosphate glucose phosphotransferase [Tannerellaceae bacterium]|jgi:putative colanic acid biosynthesis UDP-glucose lipid carrier transferase|nr:undecaprenyl-phosphate glucose phosphotransferase [Tannerellaceae bacterium]